MRGRICLLAALATGCLHTLGGPDYAEGAKKSFSAAKLRVVYAGGQWGEPEDFVARLEESLSRELGRPIEIERSPERVFWVLAGLEPDTVTVLIRPFPYFKCGNPVFAALLLSGMTLWLIPFVDSDESRWQTDIYTGSNRTDMLDFEIEERTYAWPPLLPLVPFNAVWRDVRGDRFDYFLRVYPSHLHAKLAAAQGAE